MFACCIQQHMLLSQTILLNTVRSFAQRTLGLQDLNEILDEDSQEEVYDYFLEDAETDDITAAHDEFDGDYSENELRLMKIKFMSEMAN